MFVEQLLAMLVDDGLLVPATEGWQVSGDLGSVTVPPTIGALLAARLERADFDAAHDAVGAWRGRDLNAVALRAMSFNGGGEIDRVDIGRNAHRLHCEGRVTADADTKEQRGKAKQATQLFTFILCGVHCPA